MLHPRTNDSALNGSNSSVEISAEIPSAVQERHNEYPPWAFLSISGPSAHAPFLANAADDINNDATVSTPSRHELGVSSAVSTSSSQWRMREEAAGRGETIEEPLDHKPLDHWHGLVVAVGVFFCQFGVYGALNSYSVFANQIEADAGLGHPSAAAVALPNSLVIALASPIALISGAAVDRFGPRKILLLSAISTMLGPFLVSFAPTMPCLTVLYVVPCCFASSCLNAPGSAAVSSWLSRRISLGMGVALSGDGLGSAVLVPLAGQLAATFSWRTSFKFVALYPTIAVAGALMTSFRVAPVPRPVFGESDRFFMQHIVRSTPFWFLFVAVCFFAFAFFSALYITVPYAATFGKEGSMQEGFDPISIAQASTLFIFFGLAKMCGSVGFGALASRTDARYVTMLTSGVFAASIAAWPMATNFLELAAVSVGVGLGSGGHIAGLFSLLGRCFSGPWCGLATACGLLGFSVGGFGGPPLVQAVMLAQNKSYTLSFALMAASAGLSGIVVGVGCLACGLEHEPWASGSIGVLFQAIEQDDSADDDRVEDAHGAAEPLTSS